MYNPHPRATHTVLNMGAGRQSVGILALVKLGRLPRPDLIVHANTGHERKGTLLYIENVLIPLCKKMGIPFIIVENGSIRDDTLRSVREGTRVAQAPYFVKKPTGKPGMLRRICTSEYKIVAIERGIKQFLGVKRGHRVHTKARPYYVEQWIGIATEEAQRTSDSHRVWTELTYPLLQLEMSTADCIEVIKEAGLPVPIKSACIACPFRSNSSWAYMKANQPEEFADAVEFDRMLRWPDGDGRLNWKVGANENDAPGRVRGALYPAYVHNSCVPLEDINFVDDGTGENFGGAFC
jgi:hypothetical protein